MKTLLFYNDKRLKSLFTNLIIKKLKVRDFSSRLEQNPFLSPIPLDYIRSKEKLLTSYFTMDTLDENHFAKQIKETILPSINYTVYIKVRYNIDSYFLAGNQFGFTYESDYSINDLYNVFRNKLEDYFKDYHIIDEDIVYVEISFRKFDTKIVSDFKKDRFFSNQLIAKNNIKDNNRNMLNVPISVHKATLGKLLEVVIDKNLITDIVVHMDSKTVNFLSVIRDRAKLLRTAHKDNIISFDSAFQFYLVRDKLSYVLAIKQINQHTIEKIKYSMHGVVLSHIIDSKGGGR